MSTKVFASLQEYGDGVKSHIADSLENASYQIDQRIMETQDLMIKRISDMETNVVTNLTRSMMDELINLRKPRLQQYRSPSYLEPVLAMPVSSQARLVRNSMPLRSLWERPLCDIACPCPCHARKSRGIHWKLSWLQSVVGKIEVAYRSSLSASRITHMEGCRDAGYKGSQDILFVYDFPDWLARAVFTVFASSNLNGGPSLNIRVLNRRPLAPYDPIAQYLKADDGRKIQQMLLESHISIYDVFEWNHGDPLPLIQLAVMYRSVNIIKLLLQAGADANNEQALRSVAISSLSGQSTRDKEIAQLFPIADYLAGADYTTLHLAVAGVLHLDLPEALRSPEHIKNVDRPSADGHTPLHLAAIKGDARTTRQLLRAGADPGLPGGRLHQWKALQMACYFGHYDVIRLLVNPTSYPDQEASPARSALYWILSGSRKMESQSKEAHVLRCMSLVLRHGADVNHLERYLGSTLSAAVSSDSLLCAEFLIKNGANLDIQDEDGDVPLYDALIQRSHAMVALLLDSGASLKPVNNTNERGALHVLALHADLEMIDIFAERSDRFRGVSTTAKDAHGNTPLNLLNDPERAYLASPELRQAFEDLLDRIDELEPGHGVVDEEDDDRTVVDDGGSDEEFFDAAEA